MGYLQGKAAYLCGPITNVSDDGVVWREWLSKELEDRWKIKTYNPVKQKSITGRLEIKDDKKYFAKLAADGEIDKLREEFEPILRKDLRLVDKSDFLIFYYMPRISMFGSVAELLIASFLQKKPVLCFCEPDEVKYLNPWLLSYVKKGNFHTSWDSLFSQLDAINNGNVDVRYWTISEDSE